MKMGSTLIDISVSATRSRVFHAKNGEPKWHGPHTRLCLQKGEIKEQEKNNV
jgi:hypothetical protein